MRVCVYLSERERERERAHTYVFFIPLGSVIMPQLVGFVASSSTFTSQSSSSVPSVQLRGNGRIHCNGVNMFVFGNSKAKISRRPVTCTGQFLGRT